MNKTLLIPTSSGIEAVVKRQLFKLGYADTRADNGRIVVDNCSWLDVARLNTMLYSGERVLIRLAQFDASTFDMLYDGINAINWSEWCSADCNVYVITKTVKSLLTAHNAIQSVAKKAIVNKLLKKHSFLSESGVKMTVEVALHDNVASINLDTSGVGLHKRGYRTTPYSAPLKETLANALVDLSVYNPDKVMVDLFCGSGTIPIETAMRALNMAPNVNRSFDFAGWSHLDVGNSLSLAREQCLDGVKQRKLEIYGSDIDEYAIEISKLHAKQAGVDKHITFKQLPAEKFISRDSYGVIISNPPYGERLMEENQLEELNRNLRKMFNRLDNWSMYMLTPYQYVERCLAKRATKKRHIFNAGIDCTYYSFCGAKPPKLDK